MLINFTDSKGSKYSIEPVDDRPWKTFKLKFRHKALYGYTSGTIKVCMLSGKLMFSKEYSIYVPQEVINFFEKAWENRAFL